MRDTIEKQVAQINRQMLKEERVVGLLLRQGENGLLRKSAREREMDAGVVLEMK
jgi:hypothetical protein